MPRGQPRLVVKSFRFPEGLTEELRRYYPNINTSKLLRILIDQHLTKLRIAEGTLSAPTTLYNAAKDLVNEVVEELAKPDGDEDSPHPNQ